jgi:8-amino-7-oxononanoate synthase
MLINRLKNRLSNYRLQHLIRKRAIINKQKIINFCSNDYLGIAADASVKHAFIKGVEKYGLGSGSSPVVSGYNKPHKQLEEKFAEFLNRDRAVLFNSGYHANLAVMTVLADRQSAIFSDKECHASIIEGIVLSRARHYRYQSNDVCHLEKLLKHNSFQKTSSRFIVTESVFSMTGNISPVNKFAELAQHYKSDLIIDDAHGIGILGKKGRGICEYYKLDQQNIPCLITPLGKALGSMGAIISGDKILIESLIQFAKTYLYSTALPPAVAYSTVKALEVLQSEHWRREKLWNNITYFISQAKLHALNLMSEDITPIKSIIIHNNKKALELKEKLRLKGFAVACIRPPSVPANTTRIRISLNYFHQKKEIEHLLNIVAAELLR